MNEVQPAFIIALRNLFRASGLTQKQVADAIGLSPAAICQWLSGATLPRAESLAQLLDFFRGCEISGDGWLQFEATLDLPICVSLPALKSTAQTMREYVDAHDRKGVGIARRIQMTCANLQPSDLRRVLRLVDDAVRGLAPGLSPAPASEQQAEIAEYQAAAPDAARFLWQLQSLVSCGGDPGRR